MKLAVVMPSRGLIYSQTVEEMYRELNALGIDYEVFYSHCRPIPDCFEIPTNEAIEGDFTHVLYVEEDMILPEGVVKRMADRVKHAIACDYPVGGSEGGTVMYDPEGVAFFTGCGLLMVDADLLRSLPKPIWRTDVRWLPRTEDGYVYFTVDTDDTKHYGQQDVAFGLRLYANDMPIEIMDETIGQRRIVERGKPGTNEGSHTIIEKMEIVKRLDLTHIKHVDQRQEIIIDGKRVKVSPELFTKLDKPQLPEYHKVRRGIFDIAENIKPWLLFGGDNAR